MRASAVSFAQKIVAATLAALLTFTLVPFAHAEGEGSGSVEDEAAAPGLPDQPNDSADSVILSEGTEGPSPSVTLSGAAEGGEVEGSNENSLTLASGLVGKPSSFINSDVALDGDPVIGSFTADGLTFAVAEGSTVELVGVAGAEGAFGSEVPASPQPPSAPTPEAANLVLPETVSYEGSEYTLASIGAYAFYLSGVASVTLPASVSDVDDRAFRSSDVANVGVAEGNPTYSSFDGALYDADQFSLLLIPEGKQGAVRIPKTAEVVSPSVFSHCPLVDDISVDAGSAAFASENGLLYSSDLTTLLRVPAGATEVTIREGCATIAAGTLEACANLTTINAPATVTSISPDIFHAIPTVSLPAASVILSEVSEAAEAEESDEGQASEAVAQLNTMVALSSADDGLQEVEPSAITAHLSEGADASLWESVGLCTEWDYAIDSTSVVGSAAIYGANVLSMGVLANKCTQTVTDVKVGTSFAVGEARAAFSSNSNGQAGSITLSYNGVWRLQIWSDAAKKNLMHDYSFKVTSNYGCRFKGWSTTLTGDTFVTKTVNTTMTSNNPYKVYPRWSDAFTATLEPNGGTLGATKSLTFICGDPLPSAASAIPKRTGYTFRGWYDSPIGGVRYYDQNGVARITRWEQNSNITLHAQWTKINYSLGFDTDSEPGDEDYAGEIRPDEPHSVEDGPIEVEDPKRPGYVFQGWVIPGVGGEHALDQNLVYEGDDGKWYVDASKLPDYAGSDGRVELTARWTSVISVDVPSVATFYYDLVTDQSAEAHEAALSGTTSFSSKSAVDLRVCGLESRKAAGADSLFSKGADADGLLSVYPASEGKAVTVEGAQGAVGAKPAATAVDFALDDIVLEAAFTKAGADAYKVPANGKLTLTYRLNLGADAKLDYDKVLAMEEGKPAALASLTYTFAANLPAGPFPTGNKADPLWVENTDSDLAPVGIYGLADIKTAANDMASYGKQPQESSYYKLYRGLLDEEADFQLRVDGTYHPVRLLGLCVDELSDIDGKAGMTFGFRDVFAVDNLTNSLDGSRPFDTALRDSKSNEGSWEATSMRSQLNSRFVAMLEPQMRERGTGIVPVSKHQQITGGNSWDHLQTSLDERIWIPSAYEVFGQTFPDYNAAEEILEQYRHPSYMNLGAKTFDGQPCAYWLRGAVVTNRFNYSFVSASGSIGGDGADQSQYGILPCFCL